MEKEIKVIDAISLAMCTDNGKKSAAAIIGMVMRSYECITLYPGGEEKSASIEFWGHRTSNWVIIKIDPFGQDMLTIGHNIPEEVKDFLKGRKGQKPKSLFIEE